MAFYRERELKDLAKEVSTDGIGIGGGFIVGGVIGRQAENLLFKAPVTPASPLINKAGAWLANNGAKAALYLIAKHYDAKSDMTKAATEALAGSIVYDTVLRLANSGINPANVSIGGYRILGNENISPETVQKVLRENSILRTELNKALQKLASLPSIPDSSADFKYGGNPAVGSMPFSSPAVAERQKKYGAMPFVQSPEKTAREKHFGFMTSPKETVKAFGML